MKIEIKKLESESWAVITASAVGLVGTLIAIHRLEMIAVVSFTIISLCFLSYTCLRAINHATSAEDRIDDLNQSLEKKNSNITHLEKLIEEVEIKIEINKQSLNRSDEKFRGVAWNRSDLDTEFFKSSRKNNPDVRDLIRPLNEFLDALCDSVVDIISLRKVASGAACSANIKLLYEDGHDLRYFTRSRSRNSSESRRTSEGARKELYKVSSNAIFDFIRNNVYNKYCYSNDINDFISRYVENIDTLYNLPDRQAAEFYTRFLSVPIHGRVDVRALFDGSEDFHFIPMGMDKYLIGFFTIDSKIINFNLESDKSILDEASIYAYSAIIQYLFFRSNFVKNTV